MKLVTKNTVLEKWSLIHKFIFIHKYGNRIKFSIQIWCQNQAQKIYKVPEPSAVNNKIIKRIKAPLGLAGSELDAFSCCRGQTLYWCLEPLEDPLVLVVANMMLCLQQIWGKGSKFLERADHTGCRYERMHTQG